MSQHMETTQCGIQLSQKTPYGSSVLNINSITMSATATRTVIQTAVTSRYIYCSLAFH